MFHDLGATSGAACDGCYQGLWLAAHCVGAPRAQLPSRGFPRPVRHPPGGKSAPECPAGWHFGLCWVVLDFSGLSVTIAKLVRWAKPVIFPLSVTGADE